MTEDIKAGVYRHYKGPLYLVLGLAHDANAEELARWDPDHYDGVHQRPQESLGEREVVVYVGLQLDTAHTGARLAVRTAEDFFARVCGNRNCPHFGEAGGCDNGPGHCRCNATHAVQRFKYVGARWNG